MPYMIFTGLEDYKARGSQASPYFTVTHYTEFAETKDTVLIRGDVVFTSKLTDEEAKCLLETAQSFYLNDVRYRLVERFNKETHEFEFKDVLQVLDMPTMWPHFVPSGKDSWSTLPERYVKLGYVVLSGSFSIIKELKSKALDINQSRPCWLCVPSGMML
jgi:hypothetical protein